MARWTIGGIAILALTGVAVAGSTLPGSTRGQEALDLCMAAERASENAKESILARGLALAETAVETDDTDAKAHLAVFCNLGRQMQLQGLNLGSLAGVRRLRKEIDRALALAPNSPDVLTAKGAFLAELPGFLGGDLDEAEHLLRRAIAADRGFAHAHLSLAEVLAAREARDEARVEVQRAMATATAAPAPIVQEKARALLVALTK
jgi:tetratricopeptide (TPR) repeat protein